MKLYHFMQLSPATCKSIIKKADEPARKRFYIFALLLKSIITLLFCMLIVTIYTTLFGPENSTVGVVVLIALQVFKAADLGIEAKQGAFVLFLVFGILALGPQLSAIVPLGISFIIDFSCILLIVLLCCHNLVMSNHFTFILGYLLLQGNPVIGSVYANRVIGLLLGGAVTAVIYYRSHRQTQNRRTIPDLFAEWNICSLRTQWYLKISLGVSLCMFLGYLVHLPRPMWLGFACMSVIQPFSIDTHFRLKKRAPMIVVGSIFFGVLWFLLPKSFLPYIGILGGFLVGFCGTYPWQMAVNCLGALSMAVPLYGVGGAILIRILDNTLATGYSFLFDKCLNRIFSLKKSPAA